MKIRGPARDRHGFAAVIEELEELYAQLPALSRLGLCEASCAEHIDASTAEPWAPASTWTPPLPMVCALR